ncbi:transcription factor atoh8 [Lampris incognitus]|uniref:transcription factor atoh8 n=1 Tax=Lampris incognitus TaxID=2546036 RepID=UPI0024B56B9B|nr:transcription factor atoh8 [Lampris incognitus]
MRNPHLLGLADDWTKSVSGNQSAASVVAVPSVNKKFKRKSREPKRLCKSITDQLAMKSIRRTAEEDSAHDAWEEACNDNHLAPVHRQLMPHKPMPGALLPGLPEGKPVITSSVCQSGAIDMRIGSNVPAIMAKLSQIPVSPFANTHLSPRQCTGSQSQSSSHKLSLTSNFPPVTPANTSQDDPSPSTHQPYPYLSDTSLSNRLRVNQAWGERAIPLVLPGASQTQPNGSTSEHQADSAKESLRKRMGVGADPSSGRVPEIKALQQTRRLLANARERTRVHTISAAFEALRKQVPCYSYGQKLSKLAILRIACNYILSLAQLAELDYSSDHNSLTFSQCVEQCTRTLQAEGRSKKRKE